MTDNNWKFTTVATGDRDGRITFGFPAGITIEQVHAKLEHLFFKTPYMDWVVDMANCRAITFIHGSRYSQWKKERGADSDDEEDERECDKCGHHYHDETGEPEDDDLLNFCPDCDELRDDDYECGECGERVRADADVSDWDIGKDYTETFCPNCQGEEAVAMGKVADKFVSLAV